MVAAAALAANSVYLAMITFFEWTTGRTLQNYFYQYMFLAHLALGLLLVVPFAAFVILHVLAARHRRNRMALRTGYALGGAALALLATGLILVRFGWFEIRDPRLRAVAYWLHALLPIAAAALYVWHRERGGRFRERRAWASFAAVAALAVALAVVHALNPRPKSGVPHEGDRFFSPSLVRTQRRAAAATALPDDERVLPELSSRRLSGAGLHSAHRFSSFNNPFYLASVKETRKVVQQRDGNARGSRWCAGCHDPVPLLSGTFDTASLEEPIEPTGQAGITCTVCHGITHVNSTTRQRRLPDRRAAPVSVRVQRKSVSAIRQPAAGEGQAGLPPADVSQAGAPYHRNSARPATRSTFRPRSRSTRTSFAVRTTTTGFC